MLRYTVTTEAQAEGKAFPTGTRIASIAREQKLFAEAVKTGNELL